MLRIFIGFCALVAVANGCGIPQQDQPVKSELVTVRSLSKRSIDGSRRLHVRAFGEDHHLILEPANIFAPHFRTFGVKTLDDGRVVLHNTVENEMNRKLESGSFYHVRGQPGSLYVNDDNGLQVEGILNDNLRIVPNEDGLANEERNHVAYQENIWPSNQLPIDYIIPNTSDPMNAGTRQSGNVPSTVNLEILLLFDHVGTKRLGYDDNRIKKYVGVFWNRINQLYTQTNNPRINLVLSGLMYFQKPQDQPFINNNQVDEMRALESLLPAMGKWLKENEKSFPRNDVAFLQLTPDIGKVENGQFKGTVGGVAYMRGSCGNVEYKCGYAKDRPPSYYGLAYAVHELAHTLGAPHDSDVDGCRNDKGYIMSGGQNWRFSKCSLQTMAAHVRSDAGRCTWDSPASRINLVNEFPSETAGNLEEQCQARQNDPNMEYKGGQINEKICETLRCGPKGQGYWWSLPFPAEGTPCGQQKVCKSGVCVGQYVPSLDQQCRHFGNDHVAWGTNDPNICNRLWCTKDHRQLVSIGGAKNGSPCKDGKGICISGKCYS